MDAERIAALAERVTSVERDVGRLAPTAERIAVVTTELGNLKDEVRKANQSVNQQIAAIRASIDDREQQASQEQRSLKIALISLTAVIIAALIAAAATIIAAGMHP